MNVGKGWRRLRSNEMLRHGDQWLATVGTWMYTSFAGSEVGSKIYRRRVKKARKP